MNEFVDEAKIWIKAGDGGDGCVAFRREKFIEKGGPWGGNGGSGGSVIITAKPNMKTLIKFYYHRHFRAENGRSGEGNNRTGASGNDMVLEVPCGTVIKELRQDKETILADLEKAGQSVRVAEGGRGGRGNATFTTSVNRAPRTFTPGEKRDEKLLKLELKMIAEVGIIGFPNTGKSTLISRISNARPKIADYPFTTLIPYPGVVVLDQERSFIAADIPGLIEGASEGAGLGIKFLKHIERTRLLVHMLDLTLPEIKQRYYNIREELGRFDKKLLEKPELIVGNKTDIPDTKSHVEELKSLGADVYLISAFTGEGVKELLEAVWKKLNDGTDA